MLDQILNDPELIKMIITAAAGLGMVPITNKISKKVPDYTGEQEESTK